MDLKIISVSVAIACFVSGYVGYNFASSKYQEELLKIASTYKASVESARTKEKEWQEIAKKKDEEYQEKLNSLKSNNDELVNRLRKQLSELTLRVSSASKSSSKSNGTSRERELSGRIGELVDFSNRCSKSADQYRVQLESLQSWIKSIHE